MLRSHEELDDGRERQQGGGEEGGGGEGLEVLGVVPRGQAAAPDHAGVQPRRLLRRARLVRAIEVHEVQTEAGPANAFKS